MIKLTNAEKDVMERLWVRNEPLTAREIVATETCSSWKPTYIYILINSLLKKNMIIVAGMKPAGKNYARTFVPKISRERWLLGELRDISFSPKKILGEIIENENDIQNLNKFSELIHLKRSNIAERKDYKGKEMVDE